MYHYFFSRRNYIGLLFYFSFYKLKQKKTLGKNEDILKRGMSLVKKYSQMTEEQRKELIKQAFEAKEKLQEELKETQDKVKEKEKELEKMQHQVCVFISLYTM